MAMIPTLQPLKGFGFSMLNTGKRVLHLEYEQKISTHAQMFEDGVCAAKGPTFCRRLAGKNI